MTGAAVDAAPFGSLRGPLVAGGTALRTCSADGVGHGGLVFHHDPAHDDHAMDRIAERADRARRGTLVGREGMLLDV